MDWDIFTTEGRISRTHYLIYVVVIALVAAAAGAISEILDGMASLALVTATFVVQSWASWCVMVRRAHDAGRSAMYVVWSVIVGAVGGCVGILAAILIVAGDPSATLAMIVAVIMLVVSIGMAASLFFWPPDGDNEWGVDPR